MEVKLIKVRLGYAEQLFTPKPFEEGGKLRYSCTLGIERDSENDKAIRKAIMDVSRAAWPEDFKEKIAAFKPSANKYFYQDGKTKPNSGMDDLMLAGVVQSDLAKKPLILGPRRTWKDPSDSVMKFPRLTEADGIVYSGCYVNAMIGVWAQTKKFPGIRGTILAVQFAGDGDAFTPGARAKDTDFEDLSIGADASADVDDTDFA